MLSITKCRSPFAFFGMLTFNFLPYQVVYGLVVVWSDTGRESFIISKIE
ncbi:MAG: hypothetical protein ACK4GJ_04565 [bacterium]